MTLVNRNRTGTPNTSASIASITGGVTATDGATVLQTHQSGNDGAARIGGNVETYGEFILKPSTTYTVDVITATSLSGSIAFNWYDSGIDI
jgi:hypothetical protein